MSIEEVNRLKEIFLSFYLDASVRDDFDEDDWKKLFTRNPMDVLGQMSNKELIEMLHKIFILKIGHPFSRWLLKLDMEKEKVLSIDSIILKKLSEECATCGEVPISDFGRPCTVAPPLKH